MRGSRQFAVLVITAVIASFAHAIPAQSGPRSRILAPIQSTQFQTVRGNLHRLVKPQFDRGQVDGSLPLNRVAIVFKPSPEQQQALEELLKEQQDPASPNFHKWLTPEQYAARFGMSQSDLNKVAGWLESQGLLYEGVSRSHTEIFFSGTAAQMEYALHTDIHNYLVDGKMHFSNANAPSVPAAFAGAVLAVRGLNDFRPKPHNVQTRKVPASPEFTSNQSGNHFLTPNDFATIYDVTPLYSAGYDGSGQKIAVVGQTTICPKTPCTATDTSDINAFRTAAGLSSVSAQNFKAVLVPGSGSNYMASSGDETESDLDVELSGGIAKNAQIIFVYTGNGANFNVWDSLQYAVDNNVAPVISTSYGYCESGLGSAFVQTLQQWAQQANSQGQTIVAASGDAGAADCDSGSTATGGLQVDVPSSIPEVTGMGGNQFNGDAAATVTNGNASSTQYWSGSNDSGGGSALSYIPEITWNTTSADGQLSATGGGVSTFFSKPTWQTGTGVPSDGQRDVPDISFNASPDHDGYLICSQPFFTGTNPPASCSSGFRASDQSLAVVGGTSTASPAFAAIVALLNQATQSTGQGNVNPTLYTLYASTSSAFHDVTSGDNKVPCTQGSTDCPNGGTIGYSAGVGYDLVTGLGSLDVNELLNAWPGYTSFSVSNSGTITIASAGQSGTDTITVSAVNAFNGSVNLSCTAPSGAGITCALSPQSVSLDSSTTSSQATLTVTTTANGAALRLPQSPHPAVLAAIAIPFFGIVLGGYRRRSAGVLLLILSAALFVTVTACGGGGSNGSSSNNQNSGTQAGKYTLTVTATSGNVSHNSQITVQVQ